MLRNINMHLRTGCRKSHVGDKVGDQGMFVPSVLLTDKIADDVVDAKLPRLWALLTNVPGSILVEDEIEIAFRAAGWEIVEGNLCGYFFPLVPFDTAKY